MKFACKMTCGVFVLRIIDPRFFFRASVDKRLIPLIEERPVELTGAILDGTAWDLVEKFLFY